MLSRADETKRRSLLPVETNPFIRFHSDFLENQDVSLSRRKIFQSTPGARCSANVQGSDAKRYRVGRFADAASFIWIETGQGVDLRFRYAPDGAKKFAIFAGFTKDLPAQPKFGDIGERITFARDIPTTRRNPETSSARVQGRRIHSARPGGEVRAEGHNMMTRLGRGDSGLGR